MSQYIITVIPDGNHQGRPTALIVVVRMGAMSQKQIEDAQIVGGCSQVQRSLLVFRLDIDIDSRIVEHCLDAFLVFVEDCIVKSSVTF